MDSSRWADHADLHRVVSVRYLTEIIDEPEDFRINRRTAESDCMGRHEVEIM